MSETAVETTQPPVAQEEPIVTQDHPAEPTTTEAIIQEAKSEANELNPEAVDTPKEETKEEEKKEDKKEPVKETKEKAKKGFGFLKFGKKVNIRKIPLPSWSMMARGSLLVSSSMHPRSFFPLSLTFPDVWRRADHFSQSKLFTISIDSLSIVFYFVLVCLNLRQKIRHVL
jgi:hypothetical protein